MIGALETFVECFSFVGTKLTEADSAIVREFMKQTSLMVPCYSLRPDMLNTLNDNIFSNVVITQFIMDLSFRYFVFTSDILDKLITNLKEGLCIDGDNVRENIIPKSISRSCPSNIFKEVWDNTKWWIRYLPCFHRDPVRDFLINNKHIIVLYLIYLTNNE